MDFQNFINSLEYGEEYKFYYNDKEYWISQANDRYYFTDIANKNTQTFSSIKELLIDIRVEGQSLKNIWENIKSQF
ncbi:MULTISPECIES: hypothetical protein [Vagococcus]|uniref:hypothetical protein n=1 Tax=Vagococcus TaxID=2737 RepID=UPI000E546748|nr:MULTISPECIES: hypothetical protein [Vagococcus]RHH66669.1 hypothetical protein DW196_10555 [Vagococcus sp. AM17-17]